MGRRSEQRITIAFPVRVRGTDAGGNPFDLTAQTTDISFSGAALKSVNAALAMGSKVELQCRDESAWYRVQWVGRGHGASGGRVGLRCLEIGKYIWGLAPKEWEADTYDPSHPNSAPPTNSAPALVSTVSAGAWDGHERRQFARHDCCIEGQVFLENDPSPISGKITDISLGGCYFEMFSPLPAGTAIRIALNASDATLRLTGKVRSSQAGFGMGVAFTGMGPGDFEKLRKFAPPTHEGAGRAYGKAAPEAKGVAKRFAPGPGAYADSRSYAAADDESLDVSSPEALDALVRLLLRKGIFTRGELAEELEKMKFTLS
jgi:hypothetical protein